MIISKTPYRVSLFGGGTDYHTWYQDYEFGGQVLTSSINHYCYITCGWQAPFFDYKSRFVWSKIEEVNEHSDFTHPVVRDVLDYLKIDNGVHISYRGDLPARSGLGSSSAFTVGILHALHALQGKHCGKRQLALEAVHVERNRLKENVGVQDQIETAFGGLNKIAIMKNGTFAVQPIILHPDRLSELSSHFMLFFTGLSRTASQIAGKKMASIPNKKKTMVRMYNMVDEAIDILTNTDSLEGIGELLHEGWELKRSISSDISNSLIDDIYARGRAAGALGGKLLGAGGGGFMLFFAPPERHQAIREQLSDFLCIPFQFDFTGSQIVHYSQPVYDESEMGRRNYQHLQSSQSFHEDERVKTLRVFAENEF